MTEKSNALALAQLLMLHADTIENDSIKNMVIDSATELAVLHDEIERLREALQWIASRCPTDQFVDLQPHRIHLEAAHDAGACARAALKEVP